MEWELWSGQCWGTAAVSLWSKGGHTDLVRPGICMGVEVPNWEKRVAAKGWAWGAGTLPVCRIPSILGAGCRLMAGEIGRDS